MTIISRPNTLLVVCLSLILIGIFLPLSRIHGEEDQLNSLLKNVVGKVETLVEIKNDEGTKINVKSSEAIAILFE